MVHRADRTGGVLPGSWGNVVPGWGKRALVARGPAASAGR